MSEPADEARQNVIEWLRDAYALEKGLESSLGKQSRNEDLRPEIRDHAARHLDETRRHADEVRSALGALGASTSAMKTTMGMVAQSAKGMGSVFARDERIKDLLDAYSMEHFEIACYTALAAAAKQAGLPEVVQVCRRILPDEERMAEALRHSLPDEVQDYLRETEMAAA